MHNIDIFLKKSVLRPAIPWEFIFVYIFPPFSVIFRKHEKYS